MNELELKGSIYEIIAGVQDEEILLKLRDEAQRIIGDEKDAIELEALLSAKQIARLKKNIAHSRNSSNLIAHEDVKKKYAKRFTDEQNERLKIAITESRMPENQIPYEDIKQEFAEYFRHK